MADLRDKPGRLRIGLAEASLDSTERTMLARFLHLAADELGQDLHGIWLYGSRARGEQPGPDSDVDVLVVARGGDERYGMRMIDHAFDAADYAGANPFLLAVHTYSPERVAERRAIAAFFMQEVDREKIVLAGSA